MSRNTSSPMSLTSDPATARTTNAFPHFTDGDVDLILTTTRRYKLHSTVLRRHSTLFASLLAPHHAVQLSRRALRNGVTVRYRLELRAQSQSPSSSSSSYNNNDGNGSESAFARAPLDSEGRAVQGEGSVIVEENGNGRVPGSGSAQVYSWYEKVLGAFYLVEVRLGPEGGGGTMAEVLEDAWGLVGVAERVGCVASISKSVDNALLSEGPTLHRSVTSNPLAWLNLALLLHSRAIFKEAVIHIVGNYNVHLSTPPPASFLAAHPHSLTTLDQLDPYVRGLVETKVRTLKGMCRTVDRTLMTWYPANLSRELVTGRADRDNIGRSSYQSDIMTWMALALFRHWLGQTIAADGTHHAADGGFAFYSQIARGGDAYLNREVVAGFHERFPMSRKGMSVVAGALEGFKVGVKGAVEPLLRSWSKAETGRWPVAWLTCVEVGNEECPWEKDAAKEKGKGRGKGKRKREEYEEEDGGDGMARSETVETVE